MPCASWIGLLPDGRLRAEDLDHADHGAQQAEQRRGGGDRAQRGEEALEVVRDHAAHLLDRLLHDRAGRLHVRKARGEDAAQRAARGRLLQKLRGGAGLPEFGKHVVDQVRGRHDALPQRPQPLEDQRERDDRRDDQRPDGPARGLDDGPHGHLLRQEWKRREWCLSRVANARQPVPPALPSGVSARSSRGSVGEGRGDRCPEEHDDPGDVDPDEEQRQTASAP